MIPAQHPCHGLLTHAEVVKRYGRKWAHRFTPLEWCPVCGADIHGKKLYADALGTSPSKHKQVTI